MSKTKNKDSHEELARPIVWKELLAFLANYLFVASAAVVLYFSVCFPILATNGNYLSSEAYVSSSREKYDLNLPDNATYDRYESPLKDFYFSAFPNEIADYFSGLEGQSLSIGYLYNVNVCQLPTDPTPTNYKTDFFSYVVNGDGSIDKDAICVMSDDLSTEGYADVKDIFYNAYGQLPTLLADVDATFSASLTCLYEAEGFSRLACLGLAFLAEGLLLPFFFKNGASLGEHLFHIGYANANGYRLHIYKIPLKTLLEFALPALAAYWLNPYFVVVFAVAPAFFNALSMIFSFQNRSFPDKILGMREVDLNESPIYRDRIEKEEIENGALADYQEADYTTLLSKAEEIKDGDEKTKS
jgi:hypothetical protein